MSPYWLLALIGSWIVVFSGGVYVEHEIGLAKQLGISEKQSANLAQGLANEAAFNQKWSQINVKDAPCDVAVIPSIERSLLK